MDLWGTDAWVDLWSGYRFPLQEQHSLPSKVQQVFTIVKPGAPLYLQNNLDFPKITEICELAEQKPYEICESVRILGQALREGAKSKMKAVTLLNEMLYDARVCWCVGQDRNLFGMVKQLQSFRGEVGTGGPYAGTLLLEHLLQAQVTTEMGDNIRMFSHEIEQKVKKTTPVQPPKAKPRNIDLSFEVTTQGSTNRMSSQNLNQNAMSQPAQAQATFAPPPTQSQTQSQSKPTTQPVMSKPSAPNGHNSTGPSEVPGSAATVQQPPLAPVAPPSVASAPSAQATPFGQNQAPPQPPTAQANPFGAPPPTSSRPNPVAPTGVTNPFGGGGGPPQAPVSQQNGPGGPPVAPGPPVPAWGAAAPQQNVNDSSNMRFAQTAWGQNDNTTTASNGPTAQVDGPKPPSRGPLPPKLNLDNFNQNPNLKSMNSNESFSNHNTPSNLSQSGGNLSVTGGGGGPSQGGSMFLQSLMEDDTKISSSATPTAGGVIGGKKKGNIEDLF